MGPAARPPVDARARGCGLRRRRQDEGDEGAAAESTPAEDEGSGEPIVIGAAVDLTNQMAPFDGPA